MPSRVTAPSLKSFKERGERIVCLTAYDYPSGMIADQNGVDVILVGDSLGNVVLGLSSTVPVTLDDIVHHLQAVRRGVEHALLVADLPFGSYNASVAQAVESSVRLMKAGADAVKLEGDYPDAVEALVRAGIPVMGHLGFTPQSVNLFGGHKVQGKGEDAQRIHKIAERLETAGVFGIVLELMPAETAKAITESLSVPTIGIGAGIHCDGEIQVFHDVMGLTQKSYKHAKNYTNTYQIFSEAVHAYATDVRNKDFPTSENSF